jgi:rare lipoprotein A
VPAGAKVAEGISTVAPEMAADVPADPFCVDVAQTIARLRVPATSTAAGEYKPKTKDDNTPWRFDMSQNGKRMTADEFDAWMKAKGIRVATGKPGGTAPAATETTTTAPVQTGK